MQTIADPNRLQKLILDEKQKNKIIGFVPTMGYLHKGHLQLLRTARSQCDILVLSIFVNPTQFGKNEDLGRYPKNIDADMELAEREKVDIVFFPSTKTMYPDNFSTYVEEKSISKLWCGAKRPGHFKGVATVVLKLFNIVQPDIAVFGEKDYQQSLIIRKMVKDFNMPIEILTCPIVRENDGLALSSRNTYLSPEERSCALLLKKALDYACDRFYKGVREADLIKSGMENILLNGNCARIDYIACVNNDTLEPKKILDSADRILLAVYIGKTRLIDNCQLP
ncbi:pantoate--beta-alanine ligase [bacterium]|nr:pantoate--beta-alanine ligase [bacterium]